MERVRGATRRMNLAAGIDLGGTRVKGIARDLDGDEELERTILSTEDGKFFDEAPAWANAIRDLLSDWETRFEQSFSSIGLASPGLAAKAQRSLLHRSRRRSCPTRSPTIRHRDHQGNFESCLDQLQQRRNCGIRATEINQGTRMFGRCRQSDAHGNAMSALVVKSWCRELWISRHWRSAALRSSRSKWSRRSTPSR